MNGFGVRLLVRPSRSFLRRERKRTAKKKIVISVASKTPNMDYYVRVFCQSYADAVSKPTMSKPMLTHLPPVDPTMFHKARKEMRKEKQKRKKALRAMRREATLQARYITSRIKIESERALERELACKPKLLADYKRIQFQEVLIELRAKTPCERGLSQIQKDSIADFVKSLLSGDVPAAEIGIDSVIHSLSPGDVELKDSLSELSRLIKVEPQMLSYVKSVLPSASIPLTHEISMKEADRTLVTDMMNQVSKLTARVTSSKLLDGKLDVGFSVKNEVVPIALLITGLACSHLGKVYPEYSLPSTLICVLLILAQLYGCDFYVACFKKMISAMQAATACFVETVVTTAVPELIPVFAESLDSTLFTIAGPIIAWFHYYCLGTAPR